MTIDTSTVKTRSMKDLTNPFWIKLKGLMFLGLGIVSSLLLILEAPTIRVAGLLALAIWCFCRFYYFAFYVIQHYVDPAYRFSGLWSFVCYWWWGKRRKKIYAGRFRSSIFRLHIREVASKLPP